jgi:hypothetical protein
VWVIKQFAEPAVQTQSLGRLVCEKVCCTVFPRLRRMQGGDWPLKLRVEHGHYYVLTALIHLFLNSL